jgi:hypothetical protein
MTRSLTTTTTKKKEEENSNFSLTEARLSRKKKK